MGRPSLGRLIDFVNLFISAIEIMLIILLSIILTTKVS